MDRLSPKKAKTQLNELEVVSAETVEKKGMKTSKIVTQRETIGHYPKTTRNVSGLKINQSVQSETLEEQIRRKMNNKEPLGDNLKPMLYTDKSDGVLQSMDIRREPFSIAVQAKTNILKSEAARKAAALKAEESAKAEEQPEAGQQEAHASGTHLFYNMNYRCTAC